MTAASIIIPAYNAQNTIERAVRSVLLQSLTDHEIIIAEDDSQDYKAVLASCGITDPRIDTVSTNGIATGGANARNYALSKAQGDMVVSLDADDALSEDYLEVMLPLAHVHGAVFTQVLFIDDLTNIVLDNYSKPYPSSLLSLEDLLLANIHSCTSVVFDRSRITHGWDTRIPLLEDVVFLAECCHTLGQLYHVSQPYYHYYHCAGSLCNSANEAERFLAAGAIIERLIDDNKLCIGNRDVQRSLRAYITKSNAIQQGLERALSLGEVASYQEFLGKNLELLHGE